MSWLDEEIEINGTKNTVRMWLRISGLKYDTVRERYKKGKRERTYSLRLTLEISKSRFTMRFIQ